jgi:hypothetical protein
VRSPVPKRPRAAGQVERLERVVQGDCAAPQKLRLGRARRAGSGRGTKPQHHGCVARTWLESPGRGRRVGAGRGTTPEHHGYVARPWRQWPVRGWRVGAGGDVAPEHHGYVARPWWQWPVRGRRAGAGRHTGLSRPWTLLLLFLGILSF